MSSSIGISGALRPAVAAARPCPKGSRTTRWRRTQVQPAAILILTVCAWLVLAAHAAAAPSPGLTAAASPLALADSQPVTVTIATPVQAPEPGVDWQVTVTATVSDSSPGANIYNVGFFLAPAGPWQWGQGDPVCGGVPAGANTFSCMFATERFTPGIYDLVAEVSDNLQDWGSAVQSFTVVPSPPPLVAAPAITITNPLWSPILYPPIPMSMTTPTTASVTVTYAIRGEYDTVWCTFGPGLVPSTARVPCSDTQAQLTGLTGWNPKPGTVGAAPYTFSVYASGPGGQGSGPPRGFRLMVEVPPRPGPVLRVRAHRVGPAGRTERWQLDLSQSTAYRGAHLDSFVAFDPDGHAIGPSATPTFTLLLTPGHSYIYHLFIDDSWGCGAEKILTIHAPAFGGARGLPASFSALKPARSKKISVPLGWWMCDTISADPQR